MKMILQLMVFATLLGVSLETDNSISFVPELRAQHMLNGQCDDGDTRCENIVHPDESAWKQAQSILLQMTSMDTILSTVKNNTSDLSPRCADDLDRMFHLGLQDTSVQKVLDSWGKPGAGLLQFNVLMLGSFSECRNVSINFDNRNGELRGEYCLASFKNFSIPFKWGVCFPDTCTDVDVTRVTSGIVSQLFSNAFTTAVCQQRNVPLDWRANLAIVVLSILFGFVCIGTGYDMMVRLHRLITSSDAAVGAGEEVKHLGVASTNRALMVEEYTPLLSKSVEAEATSSQPGTLVSLLLAFSAYRNACKLLSTTQPPGALGALNGLRFLSMTWVILGHTYAFILYSVDNPIEQYAFMKRWTFQPILNGTFSVDSFFVLSGLLVAYGFLREWEKNGRFTVNKWIYFYVHRYWRLTPVYMLCLMTSACLMRYLATGPFFPQNTGFELNFCKDTWWNNLLYVNNVAHKDKMCFGHSWYLANDMQFYWISPLILVALCYSAIAGHCLILLLVLTHVLSSSLIQHHDMQPHVTQSVNASQLYFHPYTRVGPYAIGLAVGFFIHKSRGRLRMPKVAILLLWLAAAAIALADLYGLRDAYTVKPLTVLQSSVYAGLSRPAWAVAVGWLLIACSCKAGGWIETFLSWRGFIPLSRLTYCAYLVHPLIMYTMYSISETPLHFSDTSMTYIFLGHLVLAYLLAFFVSVCFEAPFMQLERIVMRRK